jgi:hypothetical protein
MTIDAIFDQQWSNLLFKKLQFGGIKKDGVFHRHSNLLHPQHQQREDPQESIVNEVSTLAPLAVFTIVGRSLNG